MSAGEAEAAVVLKTETKRPHLFTGTGGKHMQAGEVIEIVQQKQGLTRADQNQTAPCFRGSTTQVTDEKAMNKIKHITNDVEEVTNRVLRQHKPFTFSFSW